MISGVDEKNRELLDLLSRSGGSLFSIKEAAHTLNMPVNKTRVQLSYLARRGWLSRVKRGLYISVPLGTLNPHEYKDNPWIIADRIFAPCYIGGWSAAEHLGLTEQIFRSIVICTGSGVRHRSTDVQGFNFILKHVGKERLKMTKNVWFGNNKICVSTPSQTIADILDDPSIGGGIRHVAEIVKNYFSSEDRNDLALLKCIKVVGNRSVYKRLGYLLEVLNINAPEVIDTCRKNISAGYSALDPTIKIKGTFNRGWNLRVNATRINE